jgi:hypothetical protein
MTSASRSRLVLRLLLVTAAISGTIVATSGTGHALFHLMSVREIFTGTSTAPSAQFIELQMYADNQRFLTGHEVAVFDDAGTEIAAFTFTGPVANGANQAHVLVATAEAEAEFDVTADLIMTPVIPSGGGKACFRSADGGLIDCAAWGGYSGPDTGTGDPFNAPLGLVPDQSMDRIITGGDDPEALEAEDDTDDSEADFEFASATPTNNEGAAVTTHERSVSLRLEGELKAVGKVRSEDGFEACTQDVRVKVQRKKDGSWKTIKTPTSDSEGSYRVKMADRPGKYRAKAPELSPSNGHKCLAAKSPVRTN